MEHPALLIVVVMFIAATIWFLIFTIASVCGRYNKKLFRSCVIIGQGPLAIFGIAACFGSEIECLLFGVALCSWYIIEVFLVCFGKWIIKTETSTAEMKENQEENYHEEN